MVWTKDSTKCALLYVITFCAVSLMQVHRIQITIIHKKAQFAKVRQGLAWYFKLVSKKTKFSIQVLFTASKGLRSYCRKPSKNSNSLTEKQILSRCLHLTNTVSQGICGYFQLTTSYFQLKLFMLYLKKNNNLHLIQYCANKELCISC